MSFVRNDHIPCYLKPENWKKSPTQRVQTSKRKELSSMPRDILQLDLMGEKIQRQKAEVLVDYLTYHLDYQFYSILLIPDPINHPLLEITPYDTVLLSPPICLAVPFPGPSFLLPSSTPKIQSSCLSILIFSHSPSPICICVCVYSHYLNCQFHTAEFQMTS